MTPETAWSESSRDLEFTSNRKLKVKLKLKLKQRVKVKKFDEEIQNRAHAEKLELKSNWKTKVFELEFWSFVTQETARSRNS